MEGHSFLLIDKRSLNLENIASQPLRSIRRLLWSLARFTNNTNGLLWRVCRIVSSMHLSLNLL